MKTRFPLGVFLFLGVAALAARAQESFDAFAERVAANWVRGNPQFATGAQYFSGAEQDALDRQLSGRIVTSGLPIDPLVRDARVAEAKKILTQLAAFDRTKLTPTQRLSAGWMESNLQQFVAAAPVADDTFVFEQFYGLHVTLVNFLTQTHPIRNPRDIENYLARLRQVAGQLDLGIAETRRQDAKGIILPRFLLDAVIGQLDRLLEPSPEKNVLVTSLDERAAKLKNVSADERAAAVTEATKIVSKEIIPAFTRVRTMLSAQLQEAKDDAGLWRLPNGAEAYAVALRGSTTTNLTAEEIH